eukprot:3734373-Pleurochrysis_carterae.AAC.1
MTVYALLVLPLRLQLPPPTYGLCTTHLQHSSAETHGSVNSQDNGHREVRSESCRIRRRGIQTAQSYDHTQAQRYAVANHGRTQPSDDAQAARNPAANGHARVHRILAAISCTLACHKLKARMDRHGTLPIGNSDGHKVPNAAAKPSSALELNSLERDRRNERRLADL